MASNTMSILNSALNMSKRKLDLAMQNISNADNDKYSAQEIETNSIVVAGAAQGVQIAAIRNKTNDILQMNLLQTTAATESSQYISNVYKEITDKLALPGSTSGIFNALNACTNAIESLAQNPSDISARNDARDKADNFANSISGLSKFLHEKRYTVDQEISRGLNEVNSILSTLHDFSSKRMLQKNGTPEHNYITDQINYELKNLSKYFALNDIHYDKSGRLHVSLKNNGHEVVGSQRYKFDYEAAADISSFIDEDKLSPIYLVAGSLDGMEKSKSIFVSGNSSDNLTYNLANGLIDGLMRVRDQVLPNVSDTVNQLATNVANVFNEIHNSGSSKTTSLNGTKEICGSDKIIGNGQIIINPMNQSGSVSNDIPALKLNLDQFTTNGVNGSFNVAGLVDEINEHFKSMSVGPRLSIDGFHSVNMAIRSCDATANNLELDFDLMSYAKNYENVNIDFEVVSVSAVGSFGSFTPNLFNPTITMANGEHKRSGVNGGPRIQLNNIASDYPITISVNIQTTVNGGIPTTATVEYRIEQPSSSDLNSMNGIINRRIVPSGLSGASDPNTQLIAGSKSQSVVKASIVNASGQVITDPNASGFLKIENVLRNELIAIDALDSNIRSTTNRYIAGNLSYAFGLNDMFIINKGERNVAVNMKLNDAIKSSPSTLAIGRMQPTDTGLFYRLGIGDTSIMNKYQKISSMKVFFDKTHDIDETQKTLVDYASDIINVNNTRAISSNIAFEANNQMKEMLVKDLGGFLGVNIDEEAMKVMQYQKTYAIAAKCLSTANSLLQTLIDNF